MADWACNFLVLRARANKGRADPEQPCAHTGQRSSSAQSGSSLGSGRPDTVWTPFFTRPDGVFPLQHNRDSRPLRTTCEARQPPLDLSLIRPRSLTGIILFAANVEPTKAPRRKALLLRYGTVQTNRPPHVLKLWVTFSISLSQE
jgi:hypothetical protein